MNNLKLFPRKASSQALRPLLAIFMLFILLCNGQAQSTKIVSGSLTDSQGFPLPGVSIHIKGTAEGTITDLDGNYSIEAPIGSYLVYKYVGFLDNEVLVTPDVEPDIKQDTKNKNIEKPEEVKEPKKVYKHTIPDGEGKTLSPYFFIQSDNPEIDKMPLKSTSAEVVISGVIADITVMQQYINEGSNTLEAIYIFPGSTKSAVYGMSMQIGSRVLKAVIKEKKQARQDYEKAKEEGKTATLLEQQRPNVFQMNVANILPGDTIEVKMQYTELIEATEGIYNFTYPTVVGPRYSEDGNSADNTNEQWVANPYLEENKSPNYKFDLSVKLNSAIPIKKLNSSTHDVSVNYKDENSAVVSLNQNEAFSGNRDFNLNYELRGGKVESGILLYEHSDENFFLLMVEPPKTPELDDIPGREYIFIVDVSGSMHGYPLDVSKAAIKQLLLKLRPTDKYNIMTFAGESKMMWKESKPATKENISKGLKFTNLTSGGGGTRLINALDKALSIKAEDGYSRSFIVLTDGYVSFEKETFITVRENLNEANLFAMGIGSSINHYLIEGLAHAGMGDSYVATNQGEAKRIGKKLMDYIEKPVLTDISIDYGDFDAYDFEPSSIPDVFAQRSIIVYGKYKGSTEGKIKINGVSGNVPYTKSFNLGKAKNQDNQALRYLWARNKIRYLDDYAHYYTHGQKPSFVDEEVKSEVTSLGLKYNLLTKYTSFIAIDDIVRATEAAKTVKQPLPLPKGVSNRAVGVDYSSAPAGSFNLSLTEDVTSLDEVVVVGYGTVKKRELTGAVYTVSSESIIENSSGDLSNALQGKVAGVNIVQNSGAPGAESTIRIRGESSIAGSNQPLYIIDGVVSSGSNPLTKLNTEDVESIKVLKDATASSIYGARASNGVVIINTKKAGGTNVKIKSVTGFNQADTKALDNRTNTPLWYKDKLRVSPYQKYDVSLSFSRGKHSILTSASYMNNKGVVANTGLKRYTSLTNIKTSLFNNKLEIGGMFNGSYSDTEHSEPIYQSFNEFPEVYINTGRSYGMVSGIYSNLKLPINGLKLNLAFSGANSDNKIKSQDNNLFEYKWQNQNTKYETGLNYKKTVYNHDFDINAWYELYTQDDKLTGYSKLSNEKDLNLNYLEKNHAAAFIFKYSYKDKYVANLSYRAENAKNGINNYKWFQSPMFGLAYNIEEEAFMQNLYFISQLKVRYTSGLAYRLYVPKYNLLNPTINPNLFNQSENFPIQISGDIKPESIYKQNLGMDIGFLQNRITATIDLFRDKTNNMFYLNNTGDNIFEWTNAGSYSNKGIDLGLKFRIITNRDFNLSADFNIAHNKTKLETLSLENNAGVFRNINGIITGQELKQGDPIGIYYGYKVKAVNNANGEIELADINNDNIIDESDRQAIANTNPKFYGGFGLNAQYKRWEFNSNFNYTSGNKVVNINDMHYYNEYSYTGDIRVKENTLFHDLYVSNGSYLRMSNISAAYTFKNVHFIGIKNIKLTASAKNLITITNYKGQDPEFNNRLFSEAQSTEMLSGVDMNFYPVSRAYFMSVELRF